MSTNLFDPNSADQSANHLQGLKDAQTGSNSQYGLNESQPFSQGADLSLHSAMNVSLADFSQGSAQGVRESQSNYSNNDITGLNHQQVVDAWNSSTTQPTTPQPATPAPATPATTDNSFIQSVVNLTNAQRQQAGLQPLQLNLKLDNSAQSHSQDMAQQHYFSHTGSDGSSPGDRVHAAGYQYSIYGENIAAGYATPQDVVQALMNSPEHRENILNPNYHDIGIGYYYLANDTGNGNYHTYWTEDFGTLSNS